MVTRFPDLFSDPMNPLNTIRRTVKGLSNEVVNVPTDETFNGKQIMEQIVVPAGYCFIEHNNACDKKQVNTVQESFDAHDRTDMVSYKCVVNWFLSHMNYGNYNEYECV